MTFVPDDPASLTNELARERNREAADRTLLAWIRTSLALISFGFGIERIGQAAVDLDGKLVGFSALSGRGVEKLMPAVFEIDRIWNKRVSTPKLNRWLREMETLHPPPLAKGRRIRLRFMSQVKTRPPTFMLSASQADELGKDYIRFLVNRLRDDFGMPGVPIRLSMRKAKNPFAGRAKKQR